MILGRFFSIAFVATLGLDLGTKALVMARFQLFDSLPLMPGLALTYVRNKGAAFSLLATAPESIRRPFFLLVTVAAFVAVIYYLKQTPLRDRVTRLALGLVAGGAIGNAVDRVRFGEVVDFIDMGVRGVFSWPIYNVADSAVCIGVGLLLWRAVKPLPEESAT